MEKHWLSWRFLESSFCKAIFWNRPRPKLPFHSLSYLQSLGTVFSVGGPKLNSWKDPLTTSKKISFDCWCILTLFSKYCFKREKEPRKERTLVPKILCGLQMASGGYAFFLTAMLLLSQSVWAVCASLSASTPPSKRKGKVWDGGIIFSTDNPWSMSWCRLSGDNQTIFPHYEVQSLARPSTPQGRESGRRRSPRQHWMTPPPPHTGYFSSKQGTFFSYLNSV